MDPRIIRLDEALPRPWRNGGGTARDLLSLPANTEAWQCQVSVADVERDGPFSDYPGVERWFAVVKGAGVVLTIDGKPFRLERQSAPLRFDGGASTTCALIGEPTRDLNLMLREAHGALVHAVEGEPWQPGAAQCGIFSAVQGRCHVEDTDIDIPAGALLWFDAAPAELTFFASEVQDAIPAWWLTVSLDGKTPPP